MTVSAQLANWETERSNILNAYRSGKIANVANGRLAQLNHNINAAYATSWTCVRCGAGVDPTEPACDCGSSRYTC